MTTIEALTGEAALARSAVYRLLSQALAYPTADAARQLREEDVPLATGLAGPFPEAIREALARAAAALAGTEQEELEARRNRIFTHVDSGDCPAYETDFTARDVWRQTQELADLAGFYRAFGMDHPGERADHVTVELEFLHLVTYKAAWAEVRAEREHAEVCRAAEERFLADHVMRWVPGFAARLRALAGDGPYAAVAELALAFLRAEGQRLGLAVDEAAPPASPAPRGVPDFQAVALCEEEP